MSAFAQLGLCTELAQQLLELGYKEPTPVQQQTIPVALQGADVVAEAQTGTGKTASFALPMIQRLQRDALEGEYRQVRGLVLVPTRELAVQVADHTLEYGRPLKMRVVSIYGGVRFDNQIRKLKRGADILVATPGRLLDLIRHNEISLKEVEMLVFDEADRMLDLGFIGDIRKLLDYIPEKRQTLLFSATLNDSVEVLADKLLTEPKRISVTERNAANKQVKQSAYAVEHSDKSDVLAFLLRNGNWQQAIVFTRTKKRADQVTFDLAAEGIRAVAIHGDRSQRDRLAALKAFTEGEAQILVATDVAARGLDIEALPLVVNYELPNVPEAYVHRIGRTGRAGLQGRAISLVGGDERRFLKAISDLLGKPIQLQPVPTLEGGKFIEGGVLSEKKRSPKNGGALNNKQASKVTTETYQADKSRKSLRPSLFKKG
jgi:ATP-dependent RNA helicase RhlE